MKNGYGRIFPGGNKKDFVWIKQSLKRRNIPYKQIKLHHDGCIFLIQQEDLHKLPKDKDGHYLGNNQRGFSIYFITEEMIADVMK